MQSISELVKTAKAIGLTRQVVNSRLAMGWDVERAHTTPKAKYRCECPIGTVSGRLVTIAAPVGKFVLCRCECGNEVERLTSAVANGRVRSCGWAGRHPRTTAEHRKAKQLSYGRAMRERRREELRTRLRKWKQDNPGLVASYDVKRRAARKAAAALPGSERKAINAIYRLAKGKSVIPCYICGKETAQGERHVDHVIPVSRGGEHVSGNLAIACAFCNVAKGAKLPEEVA